MLTVRAPAATTAFETCFEIVGIGAGGVFGGELDVIDVVAGELDGGDRFVQDLLARLLELVFQVDVAGGDEGMDARALGILKRLGGALDVEFGGSGKRGNLDPGKLAAHRIDSLEIAFGGDGEAGFQDIYAELNQLGGHPQLLGSSCCSRATVRHPAESCQKCIRGSLGLR